MLAEERFSAILEILEVKRTVSVSELTELLHISESTIRRDLVSLEKKGKLRKVHGGATLLHKEYQTQEKDVLLRSDKFLQEKRRIAQYAASFVEANDFVYLDAGTTTYQMCDFLKEKNAFYVTNGMELGKKLAMQGFQVILLAGELKVKTMALIGLETIRSMQKYNFTKAFLGTNGITVENGFTTPDPQEAFVKKEAMKRAQKSYVLADPSKYGVCTAVTFADMSDASIISIQGVEEEYKEETEILEVVL